jgi:hypothetical protein
MVEKSSTMHEIFREGAFSAFSLPPLASQSRADSS